jgi:hypothetical protein
MWVKGARTADEVSVAQALVLMWEGAPLHSQRDVEEGGEEREHRPRQRRRSEEQLLAEDLHSVLERDAVFRLTYEQAFKA